MSSPFVDDLLLRVESLQKRVDQLQSEVDRLSNADQSFQKRLRQLIHLLPLGAVFVEGEATYLNQIAIEIIGRTQEELPTTADWFTKVFTVHADAYLRFYRETKLSGRPILQVLSLTHKSGEERIVEFAGISDRSCELWLIRDLTDRHRLARLMDQTARAAEVGGWEIDTRTRKLYWTSQTYKIHEISPEEYAPELESAIHFYAPECVAVLNEAVDRGLREGEPFDLELQLITAKNRRIWVRSRGVVEFEEAQPVKLFGSIQDVTKRKEAEAEREEFQRNLLQTQKLESLGVLAGGIAHDFNNLLTGILGNAELIRYVTPPVSPVLGYVEQIEQASHRAADLCRQMLAYAGKGRFVVEPIDLSQLVSESAQLLRMSVLSKKATLTVTSACKIPPILADATQMRQVVMNLVINASEALQDQEGLIAISTGLRSAGSDSPPGPLMGCALGEGDYVFLEVSDTGCGMDEQTISRIFEPFFSTKFTGRGLGLSAVLGIVRGHHGALWLHSTPGKGTTFRIYFPPTHRPLPNVRPRETSSLEWRGKGTILVVDDEDAVRRVTIELVRSIGFDTREARDGIEAVHLMRRHFQSIRAVLLDLTMPRLDGAQTLEELRRLSSEVRVILMSGYNQREVLARFIDKGVSAVLPKPFSRELLCQSLRETLGE